MNMSESARYENMLSAARSGDRQEIQRVTSILNDALDWWSANQLAETLPSWVADARGALGRRS